MAKIRTQINCPQCGQPIAAEIEQLFDVDQDPQAKSRLLSGQFNIAQCPHCNYHGNLSTPLVYHDNSKDLLLTFIPPELNLPRDEQEKVIGGLIKQVTDALPQEKRKGYLFSPSQSLTLQGMIERILQEDGITKDMIESQQKRVNLMQRLAQISDEEAFKKAVEEEDELIDEEFFTIISRYVELSLAQGDRNSAQALTALQQALLPLTTFGKKLQEQSKEVEEAIETLQDEGEGLTREKLLDLVIDAPNETRLNAYVSLARGGMDYEFFTLLSGKIDAAKDGEKEKLTELREKLLSMTAELDEQLKARIANAQQNINALLEAEDVRAATMQVLPMIDDFFIQAINAELESANTSGDKDRLERLQQVVEVINEAAQASAGPDMQLMQDLIDADEDGRKKIFEERGPEIDSKFVESLTGLLMQLESNEEQKELAEKVRIVYREAVRHSMQTQMEK